MKEPIPNVDPSPSDDIRIGRVFGLMALVFSGTTAAPFVVFLVLFVLGRQSSPLESRLCDLVFDNGFALDLLALLSILLAFMRRGGRRMAIAATIIFLIGCALWLSGV